MNKNLPLNSLLADLPGSEFVHVGLADLAEGRETVPSLLLEIARSRLIQAGVPVPAVAKKDLDAEVRLYRLLGQDSSKDAYSQYNAHIRRLVSLGRALESRQQRLSRQAQAS